MFYCTINRSYGNAIFLKTALIAKNSSLKVTSTKFLFRKAEQFA